MKTIYEVLGDNLERLRKAKKLTQSHLAEVADISLRSYQSVVHGEFWPSKRTLDALADALGVSVNAFFTDIDLLPPHEHFPVEECLRRIAAAVQKQQPRDAAKSELYALLDSIESHNIERARQALVSVHTFQNEAENHSAGHDPKE